MTDQQNSISNDIDPNAELTIDELDVVNGSTFIGDLINRIKAAICIANANCTSHATTLP
jgi:hypothetical protein